jgi:hypothetical protein
VISQTDDEGTPSDHISVPDESSKRKGYVHHWVSRVVPIAESDENLPERNYEAAKVACVARERNGTTSVVLGNGRLLVPTVQEKTGDLLPSKKSVIE